MTWPTCQISDVFDVARGGSPRPIQNYLTDAPDGLNWIMIGDASDSSKYIETTKKRIKPEGLKKTRMVSEGDFLLTNSMSFGHPYILKTSGCIHDGWLVLSPKDGKVFPDFFYYLLGSDTLYREFSKRAAGAVVKNLNTSLVKKVQIPLPPISEQKRIAGILDAADALRVKRRDAIATLDALLQSTFLEMFGDPLANPYKWEILPFENCCEKIFKGAFSLKASSYRKEGIPFVRIADIQNRTIDLSNAVFIDEETHQQYKRSELGPGDIVFSKVGTIDRIAAIPLTISKCNCSQNNVGARLRHELFQVEFILSLLTSSPILNKIRSGSKKAVQDKLVLSELRKLPIILPPVKKQNHFVAVAQSIDQQKHQQKLHLTELDTLFASLQSRAFKGEL